MSIPNSFMGVPLHWETTHFKGITKDGQKFVYCPVGNIISWYSEDYNHDWCENCKKHFSDL